MAKQDLSFDQIVVGSGVAGLSAAVSAAERGLRTVIVERAAEGEHGGNTRYTEAYLRMKSLDAVSDDFDTHLADNAGGYIDPTFLQEAAEESQFWSSLMRSASLIDPELISAFSDAAGPTIRWLEAQGVKFDFLPTAFLTTTTTRLLPLGGGLAIVDTLTAKARALGVGFLFECTAQSLITSDSGDVVGLVARGRKGERLELRGQGVVLACGGFQGNPEMLARYLGPQSINLRPVARGGYYNKGEGIRMALDIGAAPNGDFGSYHAEPIDPRSGVPEPAVFTFPYGILVNKSGRRFTDEAPATVDAVYERVTRRIYEQEDGIAYLILDAKIEDVPNWKRSFRSDQQPFRASSIAELATICGIGAALGETVEAYNRACGQGEFKPLVLDGLTTSGLVPPKSNWARPIDKGPYLAIPIISANVFTFGGLKVNHTGQVLDQDGMPIGGLFAAGETMGLYFRNYTGSTSVLRGAVFGRLAAQHIAEQTGRP